MSAIEPAIRLPGVGEALATSTALIGRCVDSLSPADTGLFGPGSMSWRIHSHPSYAISAIAGLLFAALHPTAMAAIDQHSDYRRDAWRRAHRTAEYVFTITFSGQLVAQAAAERVRGIHRRIKGTDAADRQYAAEDEDLLMWIHCVNTEMALSGFDAFGSGCTSEDADRYVCEQVRAGVLVGLKEGALPRSRHEVNAAIATYKLQLTSPAKELLELLLCSSMPWTMRPFWAVHVFSAVDLLPAAALSLYGLSPSQRLAKNRMVVVRAIMTAIDHGFALFRPVRAARKKLRMISSESPDALGRASSS